MRMNKLLGFVLVLLGAFWFFRVVFSPLVLLLVLAGAFAWGAATGAVGRWGWGAAALCALLAVPTLIFGAVAMSVGIALRIIKMAPLLLVLVGIFMLMRAFSKK